MSSVSPDPELQLPENVENGVAEALSMPLKQAPASLVRKKIITVLICGILLLSAAAAAYFYLNHRPKLSKTVSSTKQVDATKPVKPASMTFPVTDQQKADYLAQLGAANSLVEAETVLNKFAAAYGFKVTANPTFTNAGWESLVSWKTLSEQDLGLIKDYGSWFIQEWSKYPKEWVTKTQLQNIVFVNDLSLSGSNNVVSGLVNYGQPWIFLNAANALQGQNNSVRIIHHEYGHLIDGTFASGITGAESSWKTYNPANFSYVSGSRSGSLNVVSQFIRYPQPGFVSNIAQLDSLEDRAEVYSHLFSTPHYHMLNTWLPDDPYLQKKVDYYKQLLKDAVPGMDEEYFKRIHPS